MDIVADAEDEEVRETFVLTLRSARNALLAGGGATLQVTGAIEDDDDPEVEVAFGSAGYEAGEGETVAVVVGLNRDPEREVRIPLTRTHLGGASESDYSGVPDELIFVSGLVSLDFAFAVTDDAADDDGESVVLGFGSLPHRVSSGGTGGGGTDGGTGSGGGPPRAAITASASCSAALCRARTGVPVRFEDASSGSVRQRQWDFGDGKSRGAVVDHAWSAPGFYEVVLWVSGGTSESTASLKFLVEASDPAGSCVADEETLCLQDSRYSVGVDWWTGDGVSGAGKVVYEGTNDSGLSYFFAPGDNWEILIKVLDGCGSPAIIGCSRLRQRTWGWTCWCGTR